MFRGKLVANLNSVNDTQTCQQACTMVEDCIHFVYDIETKDCQLLDSEVKECDVIIGLQVPNYSECFDAFTETTTIPKPDVTTLKPEEDTRKIDIVTNDPSQTTKNPELTTDVYY